jgi:hypothetical protein
LIRLLVFLCSPHPEATLSFHAGADNYTFVYGCLSLQQRVSLHSAFFRAAQ